MKKYYLYSAIIILLIIISYIPLFTIRYEKIEVLTSEDHFYENLQALLLLCSSGLMLFLFFRSKYERKVYFLKTKRNYFFLLLFLFFFFCFLEEISWGQRIFEIKTPEYIQKINAQGEINIHNLWIFDSYDKNGKLKTGLIRWITSERIFAVFWLIYCVIIPVLDYLSSGVRGIVRKINLPIVPIWIGFLFVLCYGISKIVGQFWLLTDYQPVEEIKETTFYFLFFVVCISFFITYKKEFSSKEPGDK